MTERVVFIHLAGNADAVPSGILTLAEEGVRTLGSRFTYGRRYSGRSNAIAVDPVSLPLDAGGAIERLPVNQLSLFGAFRDATPDYWGRRVIENRLRVPADSLPESRYLDLAGPNRSGALDFRPHRDSAAQSGRLPPVMALDHLVAAAAKVEEGEPVPAHLDVFFDGAPSVGGARPKAIVEHEGSQWIAKFPSRYDRFDVPLIEYATLELARAAGLSVPALQIRMLADGRRVLLVQRFDRLGADDAHRPVPLVSALTMTGRHESESPNSSYAEIASALSMHGVTGRIATDREELFARMVFNIAVTNDDDHLRNHAFLHDPAGSGWRLSPLFDVVPKPSASTERFLHLSVGPEGRVARYDNALHGAGAFGLLPGPAARIIDRVVGVVREWRGYFEATGVSSEQCHRVASAFPRAADIGFREAERFLGA